MLVYRKAEEATTLGAAFANLGRRVAAARTLADWREALIAAGQLEQGAHDALAPDGPASAHPDLQLSHRLTAACARAFVGHWRGGSEPDGDARALAGQAVASSATPIRLKLPEGYAYYALAPDDYCAATCAWLEQERPGSRVFVLGLRSIGTSLAAAVGATLAAHGLEVDTETTRPFGPPFARQVRLPRSPLAGARVLVVDEGPGLSGSSLLAAATALLAAGVDATDLTLMPGHDGAPGDGGVPAVRQAYAALRRRPATQRAASLQASPLVQRLLRELAATLDLTIDGVTPLPRQGPRLDRLARPSLRIATHRGPLAARFCGLASVAALGQTLTARAGERLGERAALGFARPPLLSAHGFVVTPWLEGEALAALDGELAEALADYAADMAGPPLDPVAREAALATLRELVRVNVPEAAPLEAVALPETLWPASGDGDLTRYHWLRTRAGLAKVGSPLRDTDHAGIGVQPLAWDLASLASSFALPPASWPACFGAHGVREPSTLLPFVLAHLAWEVGRLQLCLDTCDGEPAERQALEEALRQTRARARSLGAAPGLSTC